MRLPLARLFIALWVAGPLAACKQNIGDRCQLDTDCAGYPDTAYCAVPGGDRATGGTCEAKSTTSEDDLMTAPTDMLLVPEQDLSVTPDMAAPDLSIPDMTAVPDLTNKSDLVSVDLVSSGG